MSTNARSEVGDTLFFTCLGNLCDESGVRVEGGQTVG